MCCNIRLIWNFRHIPHIVCLTLWLRKYLACLCLALQQDPDGSAKFSKVRDVRLLPTPALVWSSFVLRWCIRSISQVHGVGNCWFPKELWKMCSRYHRSCELNQRLVHMLGDSVLWWWVWGCFLNCHSLLLTPCFYSGSKNRPNVWLFCKDWSRTNQENYIIF